MSAELEAASVEFVAGSTKLALSELQLLAHERRYPSWLAPQTSSWRLSNSPHAFHEAWSPGPILFCQRHSAVVCTQFLCRPSHQIQASAKLHAKLMLSLLHGYAYPARLSTCPALACLPIRYNNQLHSEFTLKIGSYYTVNTETRHILLGQ